MDQAQQEMNLEPRHMHTWLDRQGRVPSLLAAPADVWARVEHGAQNCLPEGLRFRFLWATSVRGLVPGGKSQCCSALGFTWASRLPSPLLDVPQVHRVGRDSPPQPVKSCGTEFSHHSLRVSMPLGGKYKTCLCLKPNMGVSGSPGLCPSSGPGLLATEGWAETRGRPPSYARHGSSV